MQGVFGTISKNDSERSECVARDLQNPTLRPSHRSERQAMFQITKILVPIDFSDCSRAALRYATELGNRMGADISILHAFQVPMSFSPTTPMMLGDVNATHRDRAEAAAREQLDRFLKVNPSPLLMRSSSTVQYGPPSQTILKAIRDQKHHLVVMGTHGWSGFQQLVTGSTTNQVVRQSPCPVLTVRETWAEAQAEPLGVASNGD